MLQGTVWEKYYPEVTTSFDADNLLYHNLVHLEKQASINYPDRPAVTTILPNGANTTLNYAELHDYTDDFAAYLREVVGVNAQDTVAVMTANCIAFPIAVFGAFKANCRCTNINPLYTAREMEHQLKDSNAKVLVILDLFGNKVDDVIHNTGVQHVVKLSLLDFFPFIKRQIIGFVLKKVKKIIPNMNSPHNTLAKAIKQGRALRIKSNIDVANYTKDLQKDDIALYQYTGGTTGPSKGAILTHRNILANAEQARELTEHLMDKSQGETFIIVLPLYHITAFALNLVPMLGTGSHGIMVPSPRPVSNLENTFTTFTATWFTGINTLFTALMEEKWFHKDLFKNIKFCGSGGAAQDVSVAKRWKKATGLTIYEGYGMSECAGIMTLNPVSKLVAGSCGIPVPGMQIKIIDDNGAELPANTPGQILCKGPTVMKGYLGRPGATAETLADGWLHTGDVGEIDEEGFVKIIDRLTDMILVSGFNVYPGEIEAVISQLNGVVEVGVVGIKDVKTAEAVKAFVVTSDKSISEADIISHCREQLTGYKVPKQIALIDELPKSPVGKVLRRELRLM